MTRRSYRVYDQLVDAELVALALERSPDASRAFAHLFDRYQKKLSAYLLAYSQLDKHVIDDIIQESYLRAWKKLRLLKEPEKFYSWLVSLSRNLLLDQLREIKRYTEIVNLFGESEMQRSTHQQVDSIQDALANVPQDDREIMALKIFLEYSFVEIGDLLSITESAAKMRYYRAVEKLKNETN